MSNLESQVRQESVPESVLVSSLSYLTGTKRLFGGDLETAVATLRTVASRIRFRAQGGSSSIDSPPEALNREGHIRQVLQNVFR